MLLLSSVLSFDSCALPWLTTNLLSVWLMRQKLRSRTFSTVGSLIFLRPYTSPAVHQASPLLDKETFFLNLETVRRKDKYMKSWSTHVFRVIDVKYFRNLHTGWSGSAASTGCQQSCQLETLTTFSSVALAFIRYYIFIRPVVPLTQKFIEILCLVSYHTRTVVRGIVGILQRCSDFMCNYYFQTLVLLYAPSKPCSHGRQ